MLISECQLSNSNRLKKSRSKRRFSRWCCTPISYMATYEINGLASQMY